MGSNELNSVEYYIIHQLTGVNLNNNIVAEPKAGYGAQWQFVAPNDLQRSVNEVLLEQELKEAIIRLNPEITAQPDLADEVIYKLRAVLIAVNQVGLVKANEEFFKWMSGEKTMPFGENNRHVPVRLIDFDDVTNNSYIVTNQFRVHHRETKIPDVVLFINGLPVVVGEAKTPIRPSISWLYGAHEVHDIYENAVPQLFVPNIMSFATEGKELFYGAIRCPLEFWAPWRIEGDDDKLAKQLGLGEIGKEMSDLLSPKRLLDIMQNFSLFTTNKKKQRMKVIPRFQQYEGANKIVERVKDGKVKKGLIWHFQGSGKSLLMVFAAQKLRRSPELKSPTVIVLVDRTDLDTQISGTFNAADIPNVESTDSISDLQKLLERDTRKIIISMIHKFRDAQSDLKFIIVTAKLLTGFDAPICQTMYLDKSLKDHTLLQAICRTNRLYPNKSFGRIVDYFGIFDDTARALEFDEKSVAQIISNLSELREKLPQAMEDALSHFDGVNRNLDGFEGLEAAQNAIGTDEKKDAFAKDFKYLAKLWESLSPDRILDIYQADYKWLSQVFESVRPASDNIGKLLWFSLGAQTTKLIHENIHVGDVHHLEEFVLDADVIEDIFNNPDPKNAKKLEKILVKRFKKHGDNPKFKKLSERLEELRDKAEKGLITSIEFVKELCKIAKETVQAEKELEAEIQEKSPKAALTELFLELKNDETPAVVERIVNDIDAIVRVVNFPGWQNTTSGEREVQKSLRKALLKYKLHKDQILFDRAYGYIKEYY